MTKTFRLLIFSGTIGISAIRIKREDIGNMLPICISDDLLNMCSEPFVMALNVRAVRYMKSILALVLQELYMRGL